MGTPDDEGQPRLPMPPRPAMSDSTPAPIHKAPPPATTVRVARSLWLTSIVIGAAAVVFSFLSRGDQLAPFSDTLGQFQPGLPAGERGSMAAIIILGTLVTLSVSLIVELFLVRFMTVKSRGGVRWGLLAIAAVNALVCAVASTFVGVGQYGALAAGLLLGQLLLASAALVAGFMPSAGQWFRREEQARRGASLVT